jgi:hypothetical protein
MTQANREQTAYIKEVTWNTTPSTPTGQIVPMVSNSIGQTNETVQSNIIRADTNRAGIVRTGVPVAGDIVTELQYGAVTDDFLVAALRTSAFGSALTISVTTISAASADNSFNDSGSGLPAFVPGQWIKVSGFANAANNGWFRVVSRTAAKIVVVGGTLVTASASPSITIKGTSIKNGTTDQSFSIERDFQDISQRLLTRGNRVSQLGLSFGTAAIANMTTSFIGGSSSLSGSTVFSGTTAAPTSPSMNTVNNIKKIFVDNAAITVDITNIDFNISTNPTPVRGLGSLYNTGIFTGSIGLSGNITEYFEDAAFLTKSIDFTSFKLAIVVEDDSGNGYVFDMQNCQIGSGSPDNPGIDQLITIPYSFTASYDSTHAATIGVTKY